MLVYVTNVLFVRFSPFAREKQTIANIEISLFLIHIYLLKYYMGEIQTSGQGVYMLSCIIQHREIMY